MDGNKKIYIRGVIQVIVFMLIVGLLLYGSQNFSLKNFLLGTLVFSLGVCVSVYLRVSKR